LKVIYNIMEKRLNFLY